MMFGLDLRYRRAEGGLVDARRSNAPDLRFDT